MIYTKIIKKEDGTQYKLRIHLYLPNYHDDVTKVDYDFTLDFKLKHKRIWKNIKFHPDFDKIKYNKYYNNAEYVDARKYYKEFVYSRILKNDICEAKLELWQILKP